MQVLSVRENFRGLSDKKELQIAIKFDRILITGDINFGEWIFAHQAESAGVLFLRYHVEERRYAT